jgi:DNA-binding MarR family transcriptional regulator
MVDLEFKPGPEETADWPPRDPQAERQAWDVLQACARSGETLLRLRARRDTGLSLPRHQALTKLHEKPNGLTMGELARELSVTQANATALIDHLVAEGWVTRKAAGSDRRKVMVNLTGMGRSTFGLIAATFASNLTELFAGLSLLELRLLTSLMDKWRVSVDGLLAAEPEPLRHKRHFVAAGAGPGLGWV